MKFTIIIIVIIFILLCFLLYKLTWKNRTYSKIHEFELGYHKNLERRQKDYCSKAQYLDKRRLSDYYVCSSHNPHLTGFLNYDYSSNTYLGKLIAYGCRYIELDIFDKEIRQHTEPVISSGDKVYQGQNYITCRDVFTLIAKTVFSKNKVDNHRDPFFIYLNCKTNNKNTMNQLHDIIIDTLDHVRLKEPFGTNIGNMRMCELMDKIVIFASDNIEHSTLMDVVALTPGTNSYLQRIDYNQLPIDKTLVTDDNTLPKLAISSEHVVVKGNRIKFLDTTNPIHLGITPGMKISFKEFIKINIEQVAANAIEVDHTFNLGDYKEGEELHFRIYKPVFNNRNMINFNKNGLTIVYVDNHIFPNNKDATSAWQLGCQFVAINFQKLDFEGMKYVNTFHDDSFILKPSNLRNTIKDEELEEQIPPIEYPKVNWNLVMEDAISKYFQFTLETIHRPFMFATVSNFNFNVTPVKTNKTVFVMEKGKELKSISITYTSAPGKYYLTVPEKCCYLYFSEKPDDSVKADLWKQNTTFYPVASKHLKGNISFMFIKDNKPFYISQQPPKSIKEKMKLYTSIKLYNSTTEDTFFKPPPNNDFKYVGFNFSKHKQKSITYYQGSVEKPLKIGKKIKEMNGIKLYKPTAPEGYRTMGYVASDKAPQPQLLNNIVCIKEDKLKKIEEGKETIETHGTEAHFGLYEYNGLFYDLDNTKDADFYEIDLSKNDTFIDKLFLSEMGDNSFIARKVDYDTTIMPELNLSPEIFQTTDEAPYSFNIINNKSKCLSLKKGYWAQEEELNLGMIDCRDNYGPSEFIFSNGRLSSKMFPSQCVERDGTNAIMNQCSRYKDDSQQLIYQDQILSNSDYTLDTKDGQVLFSQDNNTTWNINQEQLKTLKDEEEAYVLARVPRMKAVYYGGLIKPILDDYYTLFKDNFIDDTYFHVWIKCRIDMDEDNNYYATPLGISGDKKNVNQAQIVIDSQKKAPLNVGDKVLVNDGTYVNLNEHYVKWGATVIKKLDNNQVKVIMGPNSVEPNYNKFSAMRPRVIAEKILDVNDCIPYIPAMKVPNL